MYINSTYKGLQHTLQSMWFCDQRQGIDKLVKYEDGTLSTKLLVSLEQSRDTNVVFGEDSLFVKPGKTLGVGRQQMEF